MDPIMQQGAMPSPENEDEGKMAKADLYKTARYALKLFKMMDENAQLDGWVQAKITKAADYMASVYHYLEYEMKFSEYGQKLEMSDMYTPEEKQILKNKLLEAKEKVKDLKKAQAEKLKAKEKKKVDESEDDRGGDDDTKSDFNKIKTSSGHTRHSRKASRTKADHELKGDVPVTSLHPDHDERAAKFLAKQVRGRKVSPMDQLTKRKGMTDDEVSEAKSKKAKKDYDGDGEVETGKDEVIGSRRKAAGLPFKEASEKKCNHTAKGKSCPVHGMKECSGMSESKPSAGMSKDEKSTVAKKAQAGKDIGKPGKSFDKVAKAAGGGAKGTKVAAAAMWKNAAK